MSYEPDGSIIVDTELDTQGFKAGSSKLRKAVESLNNSVRSLGTNTRSAVNSSAKSINSLENKLLTTKQKVSSLEGELSRLGSKKITTPKYESISKAIAEADKRLKRLIDREKTLELHGVSKNSTSWKNLQLDIEQAAKELERYNEEAINLESSGKAYTLGVNTSEYRALSEELQRAKAESNSLDSEISRLKSNIESKNAKTNFLSFFSKSISTCSKGLKALVKGVKNGISHLKNLKKSAGNSGSAFDKLGKKITGLGSMLKRMVLRKVLQGVIQGVKDGINNLAQYSDEVNGNLSTLKSGLTQLKNSLATAFAPILTVITPVLSKLISYLSAAITKVGQFFAALTGKNTFTKAVAVQENYADSLDKTSKSSEKATKAAKKYGDALDIDEVHDIQSISDSDKSNSGSGVSPADMFEDVPIESKIADFAKRLKKAIKDGDFKGAGALLGNGLNSIVQSINDKISWKKVGPKVTYFVNGLTTLFNSLVSTIDWNLIGDTFAQGINTIINTIDLFATGIDWQNLFASIATGLNGLVSGIDWNQLGKTVGDLINIPIKAVYGFVTTFDWTSLGTSLADDFTTMIETIDWVKAAEGLSGAVIGIIDAITGFIEETDWQVVGNKIADFLGAIDWSGLVNSLVEGIGAALGGLASLLWGFIEDAWNDVVEWWKETAYEDGEFTIDGLLEGIGDKLSDIGNWIYENIFKPFVDGFKKAFKIHSPSKVMEEQGGFIVSGLKNGLKPLSTAGLDRISSLASSMKTKFNNLKTNAVTWGKDICQNLSDGISKNISKVSGAVTKVANKIKALIGFSEPDEGPLSNFHTYMPDMLELMADGINKNKGIALNAVSSLASDVSKKIQDGDYTFSAVGFDNKVDTAMTGFTDTIVDSFSDMLDRLQAIAENVTFTVPQVVTGIVPYGPSSGGFPKGDKQEFLNDLYELFKDLLLSIVPYKNNDDEERPIVLRGDVNIDGERAGTITAHSSFKEMVRSGLIRINDTKQGG